MKFLLLILFTAVGSVFHSFAQMRITVIDASASNKLLFDKSNPESLLSLVENNQIGFRKMDYSTSLMLLEKGLLDSKVTQRGPQSDIPLANVFGYDSMVNINGYEQFVYPPADEYYVDLNGVSRLLVVENLVEGNYVPTEIVMAKKYPGIDKYVLTGSIYYGDLTNGNMLFYAEELDPRSMEKLVNDEDQLWKTWAKDCFEIEPVGEEQLLFAKPVDGLTWNSQFHPFQQMDFYGMLQEDRIYSDNYWSREYTWPFTAEFVPNTMSYLKDYYGKDVRIEGLEWLSYPLTNTYGEDSIIVVDGETVVVMGEPDMDPYYIGITPEKTFLLYGIDPVNHKKSLRRMVFTFNKNGKQAVLADYNCSVNEYQEYYNSLISALNIAFEKDTQSDWMTTLNDEKAKGRQISLSDKKALKKMKKEYLELEVLGIPVE